MFTYTKFESSAQSNTFSLPHTIGKASIYLTINLILISLPHILVLRGRGHGRCSFRLHLFYVQIHIRLTIHTRSNDQMKIILISCIGFYTYDALTDINLAQINHLPHNVATLYFKRQAAVRLEW